MIHAHEAYIFSADRGELIDITKMAGNVYLEYYRKPMLLQFDSQYPETPQVLHHILPEYAIWWLKRRGAPGSDDLNEAMVAKAAFDEKVPPVRYQNVSEVVETSTIRFNW